MIKGKTKKIVLSLFLISTLASCNDSGKLLSKNDIQSFFKQDTNLERYSNMEAPHVEILIWDTAKNIVTLRSNYDTSLDNWAIRQGATKGIYMLSGNSLVANVAKEVQVDSKLLNKNKNRLVLYELPLPHDVKEEF